MIDRDAESLAKLEAPSSNTPCMPLIPLMSLLSWKRFGFSKKCWTSLVVTLRRLGVTPWGLSQRSCIVTSAPIRLGVFRYLWLLGREGSALAAGNSVIRKSSEMDSIFDNTISIAYC